MFLKSYKTNEIVSKEIPEYYLLLSGKKHKYLYYITVMSGFSVECPYDSPMERPSDISLSTIL